MLVENLFIIYVSFGDQTYYLVKIKQNIDTIVLKDRKIGKKKNKHSFFYYIEFTIQLNLKNKTNLLVAFSFYYAFIIFIYHQYNMLN